MNTTIILVCIVIIALGLPMVFDMSSWMEGFSVYPLDGSIDNNAFPAAQTEVLLQDTYPTIGKNELSNKDANEIWTEYPVYPLGSYAQTTNNIRYPDNPDNGTCMPASMCGALYRNKRIGDNSVQPLPPVPVNAGTRIGYFVADNQDQLIASLPYTMVG